MKKSKKMIIGIIFVIILILVSVGGYIFAINISKKQIQKNEITNDTIEEKNSNNVNSDTNIIDNSNSDDENYDNVNDVIIPEKNEEVKDSNVLPTSKEHNDEASELLTHYIGNWDDEYSENSIAIKSINNGKINFDWSIYRAAELDDLVATIVENNIATFNTLNIEDYGESWKTISGTIRFDENEIALIVDKSECEYVDAGSKYIYLIKEKVSEVNTTYSGKFPQGITIYAGEEVREKFGTSFNKTNFEIMTNKEYLNNAKEQLQRVLSKYPNGFWNELLLGGKTNKKSLVICLVGKTKATGFATYDNDTYYVFIDTTKAGPMGANIEPALFHELMHVIDFYFQSIGETYSEWKNYLPEGFEYTGRKNSHPSEDFSMCSTHAKNDEDVWFDGIYGTEDILEDRACMMSSMYLNGFSYFKKYPHLYERMKYLKNILYNNFESIRNCGYDWLE